MATVAGVTSSVETLTIRSVGIRDVSGVFHLIPLSAVDTVTNFIRGYAYHVETVGVVYDSDLALIRVAMQDAFFDMQSGVFGSGIIGDLDTQNVVALGKSPVDIRARIKTKPGNQWLIGRVYTEAFKKPLDAHGIEIPSPHRELRLSSELARRLQRLSNPLESTEATARLKWFCCCTCLLKTVNIPAILSDVFNKQFWRKSLLQPDHTVQTGKSSVE